MFVCIDDWNIDHRRWSKSCSPKEGKHLKKSILSSHFSSFGKNVTCGIARAIWQKWNVGWPLIQSEIIKLYSIRSKNSNLSNFYSKWKNNAVLPNDYLKFILSFAIFLGKIRVVLYISTSVWLLSARFNGQNMLSQCYSPFSHQIRSNQGQNPAKRKKNVITDCL